MPTYATIQFIHDFLNKGKIKTINNRMTIVWEKLFVKGQIIQMKCSQASKYVQEGYAVYYR